MMAPPSMSTPGGEPGVAKDNLDKSKKLIDDLQKKGCDVSEAKGWYEQANDMYKSGLFRTSIIYSGYALDAANELVQKIKDMVLRVTKVKARAVEMLGKEHKDMPKVDEMISQMKTAINEGRLEECQELVSEVDEMLRSGSSPYLSTTKVRTETTVKTVAPSRGYSSCPSCGNIVESTWTVCKYCDQDLRGEDESTGPAWATGGSGPLMISDRTNDDEEPVDEDMQQMETVQTQMETVEADLEKTDSEMVEEVERSVDQKTSDDMKDQQIIQSEQETVETDLESTQIKMVNDAQRTVDQETSDDQKVQEDIQRQMETVEADLEGTKVDKPVTDPSPKQEEIPPPQVAPVDAIKPPSPPPVEAPLPEPSKPLPPPPPPATVAPPPGPPVPDGPKKFSIPPLPKLDFDITSPIFSKIAADLTKCPKCGEEVEPDFLKCPFCKASLK